MDREGGEEKRCTRAKLRVSHVFIPGGRWEGMMKCGVSECGDWPRSDEPRLLEMRNPSRRI